jgi:hypothetical protein
MEAKEAQKASLSAQLQIDLITIAGDNTKSL